MNNLPAMTEEQQRKLVNWLEEGIACHVEYGFSGNALKSMQIALAALTSPPAPVLREPDGWIKCSERYPEVGQEVLIRIPVCEKFNIENGIYKGDGQFLGAWCDTRGKGRPYKVTHWMPLPPPPEASNEQ